MNFELSLAPELHSPIIPARQEAPQASRAWRVVHACDSLRQILPIVEAQAAIGIKPYVLTPEGECVGQSGFRTTRCEASKPVSLLKAWGEVRNWRRNFVNSEVEAGIPTTHADLVHAHCFSAGMTAVRNSPAVVYSLYNFIENVPHPHVHTEQSWLARSFAVAEQFVFTRAGAVVVPSGAMREELLRRGCATGNVFQIPEPLSAEVVDFLLEPRPVFPVKRKRDDDVVFFAPDFCFAACAGIPTGEAMGYELYPSEKTDCEIASSAGSALNLTHEADCLLEAFAILRHEMKQARLVVPATPACAAPLLAKSEALGIADSVFAISSTDCGRMFAEADVIIALGDSTSAAALHAMIAGVTLLAADTSGHRDLSPEGRGLLWFRRDDPQDLATRAAFLAHNPDLCRSLASAARKHLLETRSPQAIGRQYDTVYQHVFKRRRPGGALPSAGRLQPLSVSL